MTAPTDQLDTTAPAADTSSARPRKRWKKVLAWAGGVIAVLALVLGALAWWFLLPSTVDEPELAATVSHETLTVDGRERTYTAVVPDGLPADAPLWVVLHGSNGTGDMMRQFTSYELDEAAVREGAVVVYPDGYEKTWNDCRTGTSYAARKDGVDDVHFLDELVSTVATDHALDTSHVYGLGYSNGSHMLYRMASQSPGTFAGIVVNAANLPADSNTTCDPITTPVPIMLVEGTGDPINPYAGGQAGAFGQKLGEVRSAQDSAALLAGVNGVEGDPTTTLVGGEQGEDGAVTLTEYGAGTATPVRLYSVEGGGHTVPATGFRVSRIMGGSTSHLDTPTVAWEFFSGPPTS